MLGRDDVPARSPRARWVIICLVTALAAVWLAMMLGGTGPIDQRVYQALYVGGHPQLIALAKFLSFFGNPWFLIPATAAVAAWLWWRGHPHTALTMLIVPMLGRGINSLVKLDVHRLRPTLEPHLVVEKTNSFPSGHSTASMIFFLTLALLLTHRGRWRRWATAAGAAASLLVGASRVMLGVHWPSDVIGGWAFGALWVLFSLRMAEDLVERRALRR